MAQMNDELAMAILNGSGYTDNEVKQLAHRWLAPVDRPSDAAQARYVKHLEACKQVMLAMHAALGVQWGDNPYAAIDQLKAASDRPSESDRIKELEQEIAEMDAAMRVQTDRLIAAQKLTPCRHCGFYVDLQRPPHPDSESAADRSSEETK